MRGIAYGPENGPKAIDPTDFAQFDWSPTDQTKAQQHLDEMAEVAADMGAKDGGTLGGISIASYGPFASLKRSNLKNEFGLIQGDSVLPLQGLNLRETFYRGIVKKNGYRGARLTVHTDAEACAIGEALVRGTGERHLLVYLLVTEGIGLGVVQGRRALSSALHSEMGMIHVTYDPNDALHPKNDPKRAIGENGNRERSLAFERSLSEMASNGALRDRYARMHSDVEIEKIDNDTIRSDPDDTNWQMRAYYMAQACLACTVVLAPHSIVIGADVDVPRSAENKSIDHLVNDDFRDLLKGRRERQQAVFSYEELNNNNFITGPEPFSVAGSAKPFRVTGALGMCYAAGNSAYGARHPMNQEARERQ